MKWANEGLRAQGLAAGALAEGAAAEATVMSVLVRPAAGAAADAAVYLLSSGWSLSMAAPFKGL